MIQYTVTNLRRFAAWLFMLDDTPHSIAMGAAAGLFITFTPTVGLHMALVVALSLVMRMNRTAALAAVWVNNPLTIIPVFFFNYLVGAWVTGCKAMTWSGFAEMFRAALTHDSWWDNLGALFVAVGRATLDIAVPLWVGSLLVAAALSVPSYFIVRRLAEKYQARTQEAAGLEEAPVNAPEAELPGPEDDVN